MYINISETGSRKKVLSVRHPLQSGKKYATLRGGHVSSQIRERSPQPPWQLELSRQKEEIEQFALSLPAPALYQDGLKIGLLEELNFTLGVLGHRFRLIEHSNAQSE